MKFANIKYTHRNERLTIGDDMQLLAIENLYKYMGIDYDNVIRIEFDDLATYDGDYVILPISFPLISYCNGTYVTMFSKKIVPVFLGACILTPKLQKEEVEYLKKFGPIGCRDQYTFNNMIQLGIPAYLNGCMTLTFPKVRKKTLHQKVVYCIDLPKELIPYIPEDIQKDCRFISHTFYLSELDNTAEEQARKMYKEYVDNAKMVITTRMHAALPCIAAGIPVILMKDKFSYRFAGIDKIAKVYTREEYDYIDWNPEPLEYEEHKTLMLKVASNRVMDAYSKFKDICDLSSFMESRQTREEHREFIDNTFCYIKENWNEETEIHYFLWGITQTAEVVYYFINENYPNAVLDGIIDKNKRIQFLGTLTKPKEEMDLKENAYYFVCTGAAIQDSNRYFKENNIVNYYQCCDDGIHHENDT